MPDINKLLGIEESFQAPERIMRILSDEKSAHETFMNFLKEFNFDVSYDWFHEYFEDEHANRTKKKQDFTPNILSDLTSAMLNPENVLYEPSAGTGGMIIRAWNQNRMKQSSLDYSPLDFFVVADEISDRTIPFLLFNLMIRGINANVVHCNSLTRECKEIYFLWNEANNHLGFSKLFKQPHDKRLADYFQVKFIS